MIKASEARKIVEDTKERKTKELHALAERYCSEELSGIIKKQAHLENNYCIVTPPSEIFNPVRKKLLENEYQVHVVGLDSLKISW